MQIWEQVVADTIQLGGVLIFLQDHAPLDLSRWLNPLHQLLAGQAPVVVRSVADLLNGKYRTRAEDVVFFFESQKHYIQKLNSVLQGQRLLFSTEAAAPSVDFISEHIELTDWEASLQAIKTYLHQADSLFVGSKHQESSCLFLDRDDVVVRNVPYNTDPDKVELMPGIVDLIQQAHAKSMWVALVTNQSGLGRGRISWLEYKAVHQRMMDLLANQGCWLDECLWSSFIDKNAVVEGRLLASLRKPRGGMFQLVRDKLKIDMPNSLMVGDSATDLIAAYSAGVGQLYLLESDKAQGERVVLQEFRASHPQFAYSLLQRLSDLNL